MECPGEIEVLGWMQGALPRDALDRLDAHMDGCADCLAAVAALGRVAGTGPAVVTSERYVVGDEIARGGMGQVFAGTDRVLDRPVAIKTVRDPIGAARFQREMRITARLQHPAIVPVYDAGAFADGEPFYVMRHVEGGTLDRVAAAATTLAERIAIVPAVMTAIDAVAYAHDCGVIHRDLKPANVLIGRFGETVVLDWGLAKVIGDADDAGPALGSPVDLEPVLTGAGTVLGTPAYMAPEQAVGDPTDARSDVYGLGAILYHVLCGAPPARAAGVPLVPLAERVPGAPAALAAIVDRATALDPDDRYATARDLADDLRRYLAGQLVAAHRYSLRELVRRWAGRHRAALVAAAVAVVAIAVIGVIAVRRVVASRDDARAERGRAVASQTRAETQRDAAEKLVSLVIDDLGKRLDAMGRLDALVDVGRAVDDYYGELPVRDGGDGADELLRRADALAILGDARVALGDLVGAQAAYVKEDALAADAVARRRDDRTTGATCRARLRLGDLARQRGEGAAARAAYEVCAGVAAPGSARQLRELAVQALTALADVDRVEGAFDAAGKRLAAARPLAVALAGEPGEDGDRGARLLSYVDEARGLVALDAGDIATARGVFGELLTRAERAVDAAPGDTVALATLGDALTSMGRVERRVNDHAAAIAVLARARAVKQQLVDRDAGNLAWLRELGTADDNLGMAELDRGNVAAAVPHLASSHAIAVRLHDRDPSNALWTRDVAIGAAQLGDLQRALGKLDEAHALLAEAVALQDQLVAAQPNDAETQRYLAVTLLHLGDLDREREADDAAATLGRAVEILRALLAQTDTVRARTDLIGAMLALSDAQPPAARRATIAEARTLVEPLRTATPSDSAEISSAVTDVDEAWAALDP